VTADIACATERALPPDEPVSRAEPARFSQGDPGFAEFELGARALADAEQLRSSTGTLFSALLLYRSAVIALHSAHHARKSGSSGSFSPEARVGSLERSAPLSAALAELTAAQLALLRDTLGAADGEARLSALPLPDRERCLEALRHVALALAEPLAIDAGRLRRAVLLRGLKLTAVVLVALVSMAWALSRTSNLALHRSVVVSSRSPQHGVEPSRVVDGKRRNLGFHSDDQGQKHVTVDLGSVQRIRRVDVFNRADCCQERAVPLALEVSRDGREFRQLLVRLDPFSLWKAEFPATEARYVRLARRGGGEAPFHLSELEVY
jgi:hypothetical protein